MSVKKVSPEAPFIESEFSEGPAEEKEKYNFAVRERLIYKVEWLGVTVGRAVVELEDNVKMGEADAYKVKLVAETNGVVAKIFPVRNMYLSFVDRSSIHSLRSETDRREGKRVKRDETIFDHANQKAYYTDITKNTKRVIDIPESTYDILGAAYYFRTLRVKIGDSVNYNIFSNGNVYPFYADVRKKEYLEIDGLGTFKAFLVEPYIIRNGEKDKRAKARVYLSADRNRWPVYITLKGPVFTRIDIVLKEFEKTGSGENRETIPAGDGAGAG